MPYEELQGWYAYLEKRPIGWREDLRTYTILQAQGVTAHPWKIYDSLKVIFNKHNPVTDSLIGSKVLTLLSMAKNGDSIPLISEDMLE
jgi:hypothetical protein